jgi:hypothetical protein
MGLTYFLGIVLAALSVRRNAPLVRAPGAGAAVPAPAWVLPGFVALVLLLVATSGVQLRILDDAAANQTMPAWQRALPLHILTGNGLSGVRDGARLGGIVEALAVLQTLGLVGLWATLRRFGKPTPALVCLALAGACALAWEAARAQLAGPDIYAYLGFALEPHPYRPGGLPPSGPDAAVGAMWGVPLPPSPYGPVWTAFSHALVSGGGSFGAQLALFRGVGLVAMALSIVALAFAKRPLAAALFGLDPTLWQIYVAEAHNDIAGIALLLVALACRRRALVVAVACVALAGAIKLPLLAIGLVVLATAPTLRGRLVPCAVAALGGLALTFGLGGRDYLWALRRTAEIYPRVVPPGEWAAHAVLAAIAIAAIGAAVLARRFAWGAPWSFVAAAPYTAWQYLGWGIPYALLDETRGQLYLAVFPLTAFESTLIFNGAPLFDAIRAVVLLVLVSLLAIAFLRPASRAGRPSFGTA